MEVDTITEHEAAIYDRQIRLWGVEAQRRMRSSVILFCGFGALNAEICKNLVLAGVSVAIQDSKIVQVEDLGGHLFLKEDSVGKNRATASLQKVQELNPLVKVTCIAEPIAQVLDLNGYTQVCISGVPFKEQARINDLCTKEGKGFFATSAYGFAGYMFCDLGRKHCYLKKHINEKNTNADGESEITYRNVETTYCSLSDAMNVKFGELKKTNKVRRRRTTIRNAALAANEMVAALHVLRALDSGCLDISSAFDQVMTEQGDDGTFADREVVTEIVEQALEGVEVSPVCAVLGGIVGQELIKSISGKDEPVKNFFFFDGLTGNGLILDIST
mmetsp:Transcript_5076/g.11087  ORF Transcript_5076/g.11087 Transcript_5076/m.11087 type:complete len:331 (-) Transcript_5076:873-1865(-)